METVRLSLIYLEDLDIGTGTRQVRLADGSLADLTRVSLPGFLALRTYRVTPTAGQAILPNLTNALPAARIAGVTTEILTTFGTSQGLTGFMVGDATIPDRWGTQTTLTAGAQTGDAQGDWPVYTAASDLIVSALDGLFDADGRLEVTVHYFILAHRAAP